jgi:hypothetical protein
MIFIRYLFLIFTCDAKKKLIEYSVTHPVIDVIIMFKIFKNV